MKRHAMIDIETLGTEGGYIILSIGVQVFDVLVVGDSVEANEVDSHYFKLKTKEQEARGYRADHSTQLWWSSQSADARAVLAPSPDDVAVTVVLMKMLHVLKDFNVDWYWSKGAMDYNMLAHMYDNYTIATPWDFWQLRDMRTLLDQVPAAKELIADEDALHNALYDAEYQTEQLAFAMNSLHKINAVLVAPYTGEEL